MIMIGAGTGLAPFRGFLQERAAQRRRGPVATSLLFFGCRTSEDDYLYEDELSRYEADGVVKVDAVFSREGIHNDATSRMRSSSGPMRSGISSPTSAPTSMSAAMPTPWRPASAHSSRYSG